MSVPVYEPRVACMAYCYGGSVVLELDEYADVTDPLAVVKLSDHLAAVEQARAEERESMADYWGNRAFGHYRDGLVKGRADAAAAVAALRFIDPSEVNWVQDRCADAARGQEAGE